MAFGFLKGLAASTAATKSKDYKKDINLPLSGSSNPAQRALGKRQDDARKQTMDNARYDSRGKTNVQPGESVFKKLNPFYQVGKTLDKVTKR